MYPHLNLSRLVGFMSSCLEYYCKRKLPALEHHWTCLAIIIHEFRDTHAKFEICTGQMVRSDLGVLPIITHMHPRTRAHGCACTHPPCFSCSSYLARPASYSASAHFTVFAAVVFLLINLCADMCRDLCVHSYRQMYRNVYGHV